MCNKIVNQIKLAKSSQMLLYKETWIFRILIEIEFFSNMLTAPCRVYIIIPINVGLGLKGGAFSIRLKNWPVVYVKIYFMLQTNLAYAFFRSCPNGHSRLEGVPANESWTAVGVVRPSPHCRRHRFSSGRCCPVKKILDIINHSTC